MPDRDSATRPYRPTDTQHLQRLFLALWPEQRLRDDLYALTPKALSGRRVPRENLHVTLVFLGTVDADMRARVVRVASGIRARRFTLTFDQLVFRPRQRLLWVGASCVPQPLAALVDSVNEGLSACGLVPEKRPFSAHVTLARKVSKKIKNASIEPMNWNVERFVLVESSTHPAGAIYSIVQGWELNE